MLLSCGVNDVWHFTLKLGDRTFTGVPLEDYIMMAKGILRNFGLSQKKIEDAEERWLEK